MRWIVFGLALGLFSNVAFSEDEECLRDAVEIRHLRRPSEIARISLTYCDGRDNLSALDELSVIARAWGTPKPSEEELREYRERQPERSRQWLTASNRRLHPGLLNRLQAVADRFPGRALIIVSGHRPRAGSRSRHRTGRALDLQVEGVDRAEVARFARMFTKTGIGFYPRSSFTHIDVRDESAFWIDRSAPGQPADYGTWPGWELDPPQGNRIAHLGREEIRQDVRHAIDQGLSASGPAPLAPTEDSQEPPEEVSLDALDVRRRIRAAILESYRAEEIGEQSSRRQAQRQSSRVQRQSIDWTPPW